MNDFAKSQLMKYGWTEGKGLGKNETGITEAIRPKLKFDKAGIDHKDTDWNEWWETAFNKAANNIVVDSQTHGVSISVSSKSTTDGSFKTDLSEKKSKYMFSYTNFLKTSTLLNGNMLKEDNPNLPKIEKIESDATYIPLTDEELFKVCGGRTGHKGARHGLTLNGKLQRIAQQEKDLLGTSTGISMSDKLQKHNSKCQEHHCEIDINENALLPVALSSEEDSNAPKVSKTTRKKNKRRINDLSHQLNILCNVSDNDEKKNCALIETEVNPKRKRKKHRKESAMIHNVEDIRKEEEDKEIDDTPFPVSQKLEKKIREETMQDQMKDHIVEEFENVFTQKKKKKSKRKKDQNYQDGNTIIAGEDVDFNSTQAKKLKISHNSGSNVQDIIKDDDDDDSTLNNKFPTELYCIELSTKSYEIRNSTEYSESLDRHFKEEVDRLNAKIGKKKETKHRRKQKARLDKITASLEAVHFDTKESTAKNTSKRLDKRSLKKLMKKERKTKKEKRKKKK